MRKILSFRHQKLFMDSQSYQYFFQTHYSVFGGNNLSSSLYRFIQRPYSKSISAQKAALMPFVNIKDRLISFQSETGICAAWWKNTASPLAFSLTTYSFVCSERLRTVPYPTHIIYWYTFLFKRYNTQSLTSYPLFCLIHCGRSRTPPLQNYIYIILFSFFRRRFLPRCDGSRRVFVIYGSRGF